MSNVVETGKKKLLRIAAEQFATKGFSEVSVGKIISESKLGPPTLYHHFEDKEGLYLAWLAQTLTEAGAELRSLVGVGSSEQVLTRAALLLMSSPNFDVVQIISDKRLMRRPTSVETIYRLVLQNVYEPLFGIIAQAMVSRGIAPDRVDRLAHSFVIGAMSFHPRYSLQPSEPEAAAEWWVNRFMQMLN